MISRQVESAALDRINIFVKLAGFGVVVVLVAATRSVEAYTLLTVLLLFGLLTLRVSRRQLLFLLPALLSSVAITTSLHLLFGDHGGRLLAAPLGIAITDRALSEGGLYSWRISLFFATAVCFARSVSVDDLSRICLQGVAPLGKIGVPLSGLGMAVMVAVRFIPETGFQMERIRLAQRARGAKRGGGLIRRVQNLVPLLVPVVVAAIRRSEVLADCLQIRGWGRNPKRTNYQRLTLVAHDLAFSGIVICFAVTIIMVSR
jgi:energy-coupling factor transporter transmembrane protein EcfT